MLILLKTKSFVYRHRMRCGVFLFFYQNNKKWQVIATFSFAENVKSKCKKSLENFLSGIILAK